MVELHEDEKRIANVRRHGIVVVAEIIVVIIMAIFPVLFVKEVSAFMFRINIDFGLALFLYGLWLILLWVGLFTSWTNYYLDVWIITDHRIVDIEQHGLFKREVSEYRLDRIQDVTVKVNGFLAHIFGYGDLHVQTAGEATSNFIIRTTAEPYKVKEMIMQLQHEYEKRPADQRISQLIETKFRLPDNKPGNEE